MQTYILDLPPKNAGKSLLQQYWTEISNSKEHSNVSNLPPKYGFRIVSWNIKSFRDTYNKDRRKSQIDLMMTMDPDVLCLQECYYVNSIPLSYPEILTKYPYYFSVDAHKDYGNIIFSKHKIVGGKRHQLPGLIEGRGACQILMIIDGHYVNIWNCHLDVYDDTGRMRYLAIKQLLAQMDPGEIHIWCGDFNSVDRSDYTDAEWDWLNTNSRTRGVGPVPQAEIDTLKLAGFRNCFKIRGLPHPTMTCWTGKAVDFFWSRQLKYEHIRGVWTVVTDASDHYPLMMDIGFNLVDKID